LAALLGWFAYEFALPGATMILGLYAGGMSAFLFSQRWWSFAIGSVIGAITGAVLGVTLDIWWITRG